MEQFVKLDVLRKGGIGRFGYVIC